MDARTGRSLERSPGTFNVLWHRAGKPADNRTPDFRSDGLYGVKVTIRSNGKSSLNHVDTQAVQLPGETLLLRHIHAATGRLLAIPQSRVEYYNSFARHTRILQLTVCIYATRPNSKSKAYNLNSYY